MIPIYFPFTRISESIQNALFACFDQIVVYSPHPELVPASHRDLATQNRLEIRLPKEEPGDKLPILLESYYAWAQLYQGDDFDFHKFSAHYPTPPQDPSSAEIRSQILKADQNASSRKEKPLDPLLKARLFLAIAQRYDEAQESLSKDLSEISRMQQNLLRDLAPDREKTPAINSDAPISDSVEIFRPMAAERLTSWCRLYIHHRRQTEDREAQSPPLLVTSDPDAFDLIMGFGNSAEAVDSLSDSLTIYRKEGDIPAAFLSGSDETGISSEALDPYGENTYTLLGCITKKL